MLKYLVAKYWIHDLEMIVDDVHVMEVSSRSILVL